MAGRVTDEGRGAVTLTRSIGTDTALPRRNNKPNRVFCFGAVLVERTRKLSFGLFLFSFFLLNNIPPSKRAARCAYSSESNSSNPDKCRSGAFVAIYLVQELQRRNKTWQLKTL